MTVILDVETEDSFDNEGNKGYTEEQLQNLVFDNWLDSGYRLVLPDRQHLNSDYY